MTKSELIDALAERSNLTKARAELVVNCVFDAMTQALERGEGIEIRRISPSSRKVIRSSLADRRTSTAIARTPLAGVDGWRANSIQFSTVVTSLDEDEVILHPRMHVRQVSAILEKAAVVVAILTALELALEVVVAGRAFLIASGLAAMPDHFLHPPLL